MAKRVMTNSVDHALTTGFRYLFSKDLLKNKVAFITGGGSGIGFTIAEVLMRHQCQTVIASRNLERLGQAAKALSEATGQRCLPLSMDVRQPDQVRDAVRQAVKEFQRIDIVINNAAGNFLCPLAGLSEKGFKTVQEIDTMGTFNVSKAVFDECFSKQGGGNIVNITATLQRRGDAFMGHAGAAKAAIEALARSMAVEWGPMGVRVNCVAPGPIADTEGFGRLGGPALDQNWIKSFLPRQRLGSRLDIANSVLFLCSEASDWMTGEVLTVDGGAWLSAANSAVQMQQLMEKAAPKL